MIHEKVLITLKCNINKKKLIINYLFLLLMIKKKSLNKLTTTR